MSAPFETTSVPGVYKRGPSYYCAVNQDGATRRVRAGKKLDDAVRLKRKLQVDRDKGIDIAASREREKLGDYADEWIKSYAGRGRNRISERTKAEYARDLKRLPSWFRRIPLGKLRPRAIEDLIAEYQTESDLSDASIKRLLAPLRACLGDAHRHGDVATNPSLGVRVRLRPKVVEDEDEQVKALTRAELSRLIAATKPEWQPLMRFLAVSGCRISEALALEWRDLDLGGPEPTAKIRRAVKHGQAERVGVPKSASSRRTLPLPLSVAAELKRRRLASMFSQDTDLVFPSRRGTVMSYGNLRERVLTPAREAAELWDCGFHAIRHSVASALIEDGRSIVQVSRFLGHSDPGFTLRVYAHLMDDGLGGAVELGAVTAA